MSGLRVCACGARLGASRNGRGQLKPSPAVASQGEDEAGPPQCRDKLSIPLFEFGSGFILLLLCVFFSLFYLVFLILD